MVKGNWERRAQLASQRREEVKQKKASAGSSKNHFESCYCKLSKEEDFSDYMVWLSLQNDSDTCCSSFLRYEHCPKMKKCKLPHLSVGLGDLVLNGQTRLPSAEEHVETEESKVDIAVSLQTICSRDIYRIRFIALGKELVFDHKNPSVWDKFYSQRKYDKVGIPRTQLKCIAEGDEKESESIELEKKLHHISISSQPMEMFLWVFTAPDLAFRVLSYSTYGEIVCFSQCSKRIRNTIFLIKNDQEDADRRSLRLLLKEANSMHASKIKEEISRNKKMKKKKSKQSHLKSTAKKDGFARGGNCA